MVDHNPGRRRAAMHRRFEKVPAGVHLLDPRFSPTAIFSNNLPTTSDPLGFPFPPVITEQNPPPPPNTPITTSSPTSSTSTSTSTSTSSSTSSTISSSSSTTSTTPTTTSTTSTTPLTTQHTTAIVTVSRATSITSSTTSASPSVTPVTATRTGAIVGGIGGGIIGFALLAFVVAFLLRRFRKRGAEDNAFDANTFRRSAVLMDDPPTHEDTIARGFNPRSPSMIERRFASPAPAMLSTKYPAPAPDAGYSDSSNAQGYGATESYSHYTSYSPGQVMNVSSPPQTATSADPFFTPSVYGQSPFSPLASPISTVNQTYNERGEFVAGPVLTRQSSRSNLSRQPSAAMAAYSVNAAIARQPSARDPSAANPVQYVTTASDLTSQNVPANDYVDLARSSVTPFQAAQYAEISRRLNTEVPGGLNTPAVREYVQGRMGSATEDQGAEYEEVPPLPPKDRASPFADPTSAPPSPQTNYVVPHEDELVPEPASPASIAQDLDFPAPPSTTHVATSRYRIDSTPPMLPEILVQSRGSVSSLSGYDFPSSVRGSLTPSAVSSGFLMAESSGLFPESPLGSRFPATPSPLASSFGFLNTPSAVGKGSFPVTPVERDFHTAITATTDDDRTITSASASTRAPVEDTAVAQPGGKKRPDTVYTLYGPEDAYGGI